MNSGAVSVYLIASKISRTSAISAALLSILIMDIFHIDAISWQIGLAIAALALGIPHGAVDHLISLPKNSPRKLIIFVSAYVAIAVVAGAAIFQWNIIGFQLVLIMSFIHFGIGDATFLVELGDAREQPRKRIMVKFFYALSSGALPVFLPLTSSETQKALNKIHPALIDWAGTGAARIRAAVLIFAAITALLLIFTRGWRELLDLTALFALSFFAPPLVAFAVYFGLWHALRHTARLTQLLSPARQYSDAGQPGKSLISASIPGLPALIGAVVIAAGFIIFRGEKFSTDFFWNLLVIVWALTVPHMLVTARIDRRVLNKYSAKR